MEKEQQYRLELIKLGSYVISCRKNNTDKWMEGLCDMINKTYTFLGMGIRVRYDGDIRTIYKLKEETNKPINEKEKK